MALNFPSNPSDGDTYVALGRGWQYNATSGSWEALIRVNTAFDTDDIVEGTTNLFQTDERVDDRVGSLIQAGNNITVNYDDAANSLTITGVTNSLDGDLIPDADLTYDIGSTTARWRDLHVGGTTIHLGTIDLKDSSGNFIVTDGAGNPLFDSTSIASSTLTGSLLGITDGVTTETIEQGNTLTISGTANEIDVAVSATDTLTIGLPNDVTVSNNLTVGGYLAGPATFTIDPAAVGDATGTVVILGNLQVDGTTTTINSTDLTVDDLNITIASGAANAAAADGAGLTVDGAGATFTYDAANDRWAMNKDLATNLVGNVTGNITGNITGQVSDISNHDTDALSEGATNLYFTDARADARITAASVGDLSDVDITTSAPTANQALVWDAVNSKFIPGDSFSQSDFDTAFAAKDTDDLSEGVTNLYYTDTRADARVALQTGANLDLSSKTTTDLTEGTNLYYTDARADARIAAASIDDLTDVDITSSAPTANQSLIWDAVNSKFIPGDSFSQSDFDTAFALKSVDDLSDVDITTAAPTSGQALIWDAVNSKFIPGDSFSQSDFDTAFALKSINDLSDVNTASVADGEILKYVSASSEFQTSLITNNMLDPTNVFADQFTASGSTASFTLSQDPGSKNAVQVFVDGVPQLATNYTVVGTTLTLGGTPTVGQIVEVRGYGIGLPVGTVADNSITGAKLQDNSVTLDKIAQSNFNTAETFTGDGNTASYTLSIDAGSPYAVQVYVAGVWQKPVTNYTLVGTTLTFASNIPLGQEVYVRYYGTYLNVGTVADASITGVKLQDGTITTDKIASGAYASQTFTGDNSTVAFTLNNDPGTAQALLVMVDNVIQEPTENYTVSGTTLTFTGAPALNARIYVRYLGLPLSSGNIPADNSVTNAKLNLTYTSNQYTGDNSTVDYTIASGHTANSVLVILDGSILPPTDYSIAGTTLTFTSAPLLNQSIDIRYMPV